MATNELVGALAQLWRFPVKSMLGERLDAAQITDRGLLGDRAYGLIDATTGKVVSAKSVQAFPGLFACRACFVEPPRPGEPLPPVRITLPDGTVVTSDSPNVNAMLSEFFHRDVMLARAAPDDFTIDQHHPDLAEHDPARQNDTVSESKLGAALFAQIGMQSPVPAGSFLDVFPVSVLTSSTLDRLNTLRSESRFDVRRFRMNLIVGTHAAGFVENDWVGRSLSIGNDVALHVTMPDPRCVMTTLAQEDLPQDIDVLRTLTRHNNIQVATLGTFPCAGVYAVVESAGTVRQGDRIVLR